MPVNVEAQRVDRYAWPTEQEEGVGVTSARIARHLARAGIRVIGFLPTGLESAGEARGAPGLAPLLASVAGALVGFVDQDVAIIDTWRTWSKSSGGDGDGGDGARQGGGDGGGDGEGPRARLREIRPRVVEITPAPSDDAAAAAVALQNTLRILRGEVGAVLVDIGGYASPGTAPATLALCDGVALVVSARRARMAAVKALHAHIPSAKRLGVILVGSRSL